MSTVYNFIAFLKKKKIDFNKFLGLKMKLCVFFSEDDRKLLVTRMTTEFSKGENTW